MRTSKSQINHALNPSKMQGFDLEMSLNMNLQRSCYPLAPSIAELLKLIALPD